MPPLEVFAASLGLVSVWLTVRERIAAWPIGAVMVALYVYVFASARLYADAGLQVVYLILQFYGWYEWARGGEGRTALRVSRTGMAVMAAGLAAGVVGTVGLGWMLSTYTNQALPYWDSGIAAFSLVAQWMMARKLIENWLLWCVIDVVAVGVYASRGLTATAVLYAVYVGMAVAGYRAWNRSRLAPIPAPPNDPQRAQ